MLFTTKMLSLNVLCYEVFSCFVSVILESTSQFLKMPFFNLNDSLFIKALKQTFFTFME